MGELLLTAFSAVWLGVLTSISPCPLATNVAAISYLSRRVENPRRVLWTGLFYTAGRTLTYVLLGVLLVSSLLAVPHVSHFLQKTMGKALGPILIVAGMFLLELIRLSPRGGAGVSDGMKARADKSGPWGALVLGAFFALAFCPISAALFFGTLVPMAVKSGSPFFLPCLYGVGTALPVVVLAAVITLGLRGVGRLFDRITRVEQWARPITGIVFIGAGIYLTLVYIFGVL